MVKTLKFFVKKKKERGSYEIKGAKVLDLVSYV